jgi:hypothetical protein
LSVVFAPPVVGNPVVVLVPPPIVAIAPPVSTPRPSPLVVLAPPLLGEPPTLACSTSVDDSLHASAAKLAATKNH